MSLKGPTDEDLKHLEDVFSWEDEDIKKWDALVERSKPLELDYAKLFDFYTKEMQEGPHPTGVEYRFKSTLGYLSCKVAQHTIRDPLEKSLMFRQAADWYEKADEVVGCYTDNAFSQSEACAGVAHYRKKAGLDDTVTKFFADRRHELLKEMLGGREYKLVEEEKHN